MRPLLPQGGDCSKCAAGRTKPPKSRRVLPDCNFNRAFETAVLAGFKDIERTIDLTEGGLVVSPDENSRRAAALRKMLAQMPEKGKNAFLITHKPNIIDALGEDWFDVKKAKHRFSSPSTARIGLWRACKWRTGRSSLPSSRGAHGGGGRNVIPGARVCCRSDTLRQKIPVRVP